MTTWHLCRLLLRSRVLRALLLATVAAAAVSGLAQGSVAALSLSPEQRATSTMGNAQALVSLNGFVRPGQQPPPPSGSLEARGVSAETVLSAPVNLVSGQTFMSNVSFQETAAPSPGLEERVVLTRGRWGTRPGECAASGLAAHQWAATEGGIRFTVTGTVELPFEPGTPALICAPGTWASWQPDPAKYHDLTAQMEYWLAGAPDRVEQVVSALPETADAVLRSDIAQPRPISASEVMGLLALVATAMVAVPLLFVMGVMRWHGEVAGVLARCGVPPATVRRAVWPSAVLGAAVAAVVGGLTGQTLSLLARPLLSNMVVGPLSPWSLSWGALGQAALLAAAGAAVGVLIGMTGRRRRGVPRQLGWKALAALAVLTVGLLVAGGMALATSADVEQLAAARWRMVIGLLLFTTGGALAAPLIHHLLARVLARRGVSAQALGARLMLESGRRWAASVTAMALALGMLSVLPVNIPANMAAFPTGYPRGSAAVAVWHKDMWEVPTGVIKAFERDLGLPQPVVLQTTSVGPPGGRGLVYLFQNLVDAEKVLGSLPPHVVDELHRGGLAVPGGRTHETVQLLDENGNPVMTVETTGFAPAPERRLDQGFGFGLTGQLPGLVRLHLETVHIYLELSQTQVQDARAWPDRSGNSAMGVSGYNQPFPPPQWLVVSLILFCALLVPAVLMGVRRELRALRPVAASLGAVGMPARWTRRVMRTVVTASLWTALFTSVTAAVAATAILAHTNPGAFSMTGIPWLAVGIVVLGISLVAEVVTRASVLQLRHEETRATI